MAGFSYYLDAAASARCDEMTVQTEAFGQFTTPQQKMQLARMDWKARWYSLVRHPRRPKLYGGNFGIWRRDFEAVNGFNEEFVGWGCEDDEFRVRLVRAGIRLRTIIRDAPTYHLWHPPVPSYPERWQEGANVRRLARERLRASERCAQGLQAPAA
jgi:GT2 family glycosyltransferase